MAWEEIQDAPEIPNQEGRWEEVADAPPPHKSTNRDVKNESTFDFWKRGATRTAADVAEGALDSIEWLMNAINPGTHIARELGKEKESLTSRARGALDTATGGYTKPQSENEKDFGDIAKFIGASLPGGGGGIAKGAVPFIMNMTRRAVLGAIGGVSSKVAHGLTGSDGAATTASIAVPLLASLASRSFQSFGKNLYNQAMKLVPKGTTIPTKPVLNDVNQALKDIAKMRPDAEKDYAIKYLKSFKKDLASKKQVSFHDVLNEKRVLSAKAAKEMGFYHDKKAPALLRAYNAIDKSAHDYGSKVNPKFGEIFQMAEEAWKHGSQTNTSMRQLFRSLRDVGLDEPGAKKALIKLMGNQALSKMTLGLPQMLIRRSKEAFKSPVLRQAHGKSIIEGTQSAMTQQE